MAYGFEIINANGYISATSEDDNGTLYFLRPSGTGTITVNTANGVGDGYYGTATVASNANVSSGESIAFIRPTSVAGYFDAATYDDTTIRVWGNNNTTYDYKVFDPISSIAASNFTGYGINAWDSNGDLTYSSQSLNAQIIGSITESTSYTQTQAEFDTWGIPWVSVAAQNHKYEFRSLNFVSGGYDGTNDYYTKGGMSFLTFSPTVASGVFPYENAYCSFDLSGVGPAPGDKVSTIPSGAMKWLIAYFPN